MYYEREGREGEAGRDEKQRGGGGERRRKGEKKRNIEVRERGEGENLLIVNVQGQINSWSVPIVSEHVAATPLSYDSLFLPGREKNRSLLFELL